MPRPGLVRKCSEFNEILVQKTANTIGEETPAISPEEEMFGKEISVKIGKLGYYLNDIDELFQSDGTREIKITAKRTDGIFNLLNEPVLKM